MDNTSLAQRFFTFVEQAENRQELKVILLAVGLVLLFFVPVWRRGALTKRGNWAFGVALVLVAALSVAAYFEFGWKRYGRYMNPHDVYHYYMGAKYSPEHEYFNLYRCALIADYEMNREFTGTAIRNLNDHSYEPVSVVLSKAEAYKLPFTESRWTEFKKDLAYFQACVRYDRGKFEHMVRDKGYNATPVWNTVARWLAEAAPTPHADWQILRDNLHEIEAHWGWPNFNAQRLWSQVDINLTTCRTTLDPANPLHINNLAALDEFETRIAQLRTMPGNAPGAEDQWTAAWALLAQADPGSPWPLRLLTYLDLAFLLVMFAFVWWAFGWRVMLLLVIFHGLNFFMNFVHIKGAFMRLDWVCLLVMAICLLKRRWFIAAGAVMAYAGMARMFPFVFLFGVGAVFSWHLLGWLSDRLRRDAESRPFAWRYVRFFASVGVTGALLVGITWVDQGGFGLWKNFFDKIEVHNTDISTTRVGFKYALLGMESRSQDLNSVFAPLRDVFTQSREAYERLAAAAASPDAPGWLQAVGERVLKVGARPPGLAGMWRDLIILRLIVLAFVMLVLWAACVRLAAWEAVALSFVAGYFLASPTFYYYVMLIVPLMLFLPRLELPTRIAGAVLFFLICIAAYFAAWFNYQSLELHYVLSMLLLVGCIYMVIAAYLTPRAAPEPVPVTKAPKTESHILVTHDEPPAVLAEGRLERLGTGEGVSPAPPPEPAVAIPADAKDKKGSPLRDFAIAALAGMLVGGVVLVVASFFLVRPQEVVPAEESSVEVPATETPPEPPPDTTAPQEEPVAVYAPPLEPGQASLVFVGDVMLARNVERSIRENNRDFTYPFQATAPYLRGADIAFANLECAVSGRGEKLDKRYTFNAPSQAMEGLVYAGFDILSLANNHTLDYGPIALQDTVRLLQDQNIRVLGLSADEAPQEPVIMEANGVKVGFLGYCDPVPPWSCAPEFDVFEVRPPKANTDALERDIKALRPQVDIVVVSLSWGVEYTPEPTEHSVTLGRFIIDQGADIVAGHHAHVQHEPELYKGGLILYSLGNFVFDQWSRPPTRDSRLYRVVVDGQGVAEAAYLPLIIPRNEWQPTPTSDTFVTVGAAAEAP